MSVFVFQESGRSHARAYRWHRQLQSVVPGRARFRVSKRRFTAIVVVVVVVAAAAAAAATAVRRSLCSFAGDSSTQGGSHLFPSWTLLHVQVQARHERRKGYRDRYRRQYPQSLHLPS